MQEISDGLSFRKQPRINKGTNAGTILKCSISVLIQLAKFGLAFQKLKNTESLKMSSKLLSKLLIGRSKHFFLIITEKKSSKVTARYVSQKNKS